MPAPAIIVENLSKSYLVGHRRQRDGQQGNTALRDILGREIRNVARKAADVVLGRQVVQGDEIEEFWALRDVSFEVEEGEVLGIIGHNGAGKSTLLKILSRITEPTEGRITLRGRVASLLEVGTGFHPELTGRENIYLNGAILGMTHAEITRKFDEIIAFAEIDKFLDTPVKRYSSGMYVRLAFAVAAHLEPEILIVDEVLAVGDVEFQKKCLGKMSEVSRGGRTVLFVSHNLAAVDRLSSRAILLKDGKVTLKGDTHSVTRAYLSSVTTPVTGWVDVKSASRKVEGTGAAVIQKLRLRNQGSVPYGGEISFDIMASVVNKIDRLRVSFTIFEINGSPVGTGYSDEIYISEPNASVVLTTRINSIHLAPGQYFMGVAIGRGNYRSGFLDYDVVLDCMYFEVVSPPGQNGMMPIWNPSWGSFIFENVKLDILTEANPIVAELSRD